MGIGTLGLVTAFGYSMARQAAIKARMERAGRSVDPGSLLIADIILSTTGQAISKGIRAGTGSAVSHAILYVGGDQVVEAVGEGVVFRPVVEALGGAIRAAVYRHPDLTETQALKIRDFAGMQIGKPYDTLGAAGSVVPVLCNVAASPDKFFCSELILAAYEYAGTPLTDSGAACGSPDSILQAHFSNTLDYVGHLAADL